MYFKYILRPRQCYLLCLFINTTDVNALERNWHNSINHYLHSRSWKFNNLFVFQESKVSSCLLHHLSWFRKLIRPMFTIFCLYTHMPKEIWTTRLESCFERKTPKTLEMWIVETQSPYVTKSITLMGDVARALQRNINCCGICMLYKKLTGYDWPLLKLAYYSRQICRVWLCLWCILSNKTKPKCQLAHW